MRNAECGMTEMGNAKCEMAEREMETGGSAEPFNRSAKGGNWGNIGG